MAMDTYLYESGASLSTLFAMLCTVCHFVYVYVAFSLLLSTDFL